MNLLIKPNKDLPEIVSVTPRSAGWAYVSFSAHKLAPGETLSFSDDSNELCVVVLTGIVSAQTDGFDWKGHAENLRVITSEARDLAFRVTAKSEIPRFARDDRRSTRADG